MKMTIFILLAVQLLAIASSVDDAQVAESAYVKASEIYVVMAGSGEARQVTGDGIPKGYVVLSNDGRRIAFVRETHRKELSDIVVVQPDGKVLQDIHFRPAGENVIGMRFVEGLLWISARRLAAYGSLNPSTVEYAVIDVVTGQEVGGYYVDGFALVPSPDGSHVAYEGYIPHFDADAEHRPQLCLDNECDFGRDGRGYPRGDRHVEFTGRPVWSPDGSKVAIAAEDYTTKAESIIVREAAGKTVEFAAPPEAGGRLSFAWEDSTVRIKAANGEWKLQPDRAGSLVWFRMK